MKFKLFKLAAAIAVIIALTGCSSGTKPIAQESSSEINDNKVTIVTSFYPLYIAAANIAKDVPGVEVINMTKAQTGCLHDYQLTTQDVKTLEKADIFIINGAGMESFMDKVAAQIPNLQIIEAAKGLELLSGNPHVWVSVSGAIEQVENISKQLRSIDTDNAALYDKNTQAYIQKLEDLKARMHESLDNIKNKNIVTFHEAFPYFAKEFNLTIAAVIEREAGTEPSAGELAGTIEIIRRSNIKALFAEPQYPAKAADTIARETGAKVYILDPVASGSLDLDSYINIMNNNLKVLKEALN